MLEKMGFTEIVRYLFSGCVGALGVLILEDVSIQEILNWVFVNPWATTPGSATVLTVSFFLAGYILFNLYRGFVYELLLIPLKGTLGRISGVYTYREFIRDVWEKENHRRLGSIQSERLYAVIIATLMTDFYKKTAPPITTGLHFLYYTSLLLFSCTLVRISDLWPYSVLAILTFFIVLLADWHFEKRELLLFRFHKKHVVDTIERIRDADVSQHDGR